MEISEQASPILNVDNDNNGNKSSEKQSEISICDLIPSSLS